jgi:serine/threonine protein kinase
VLADIASALKYLHGQELVHNNIKPGNILLSKERGAFLCDFELITVLPSRTSRGGTPWYIPPEYIAINQRGKPGDVFAFGVTMLYLWGLLPLPGTTHRGFTITDIYSLKTELRQEARNKMASWLREVEAARAQLELSTEGFIIRDMLSPKVRATTAELVNRLKDELYKRKHRPQLKEKISDRVACGPEKEESQKSIDHGFTTEEIEIE